MSDFSMETLKLLRQQTGVGLTKCKEALTECHGNLEEAVVYLRKLGLASAGKKEHRETKEGVVAAKTDARGTAVVEVNVETDFVANNAVFLSFVDSLVESVLNHRTADLDALLQLPSSQDPSITVDELRAITMQTVGENIRIRRIAYLPAVSDESIGIYSHGNGKVLAITVLSGSSDHVDLARDISMHIVATQPQFVSKESIPDDILSREREIICSQVQGKPQAILDKIVQGKLETFFQDSCLLEQAFIKNPDVTIHHLINEAQKMSGRSIKVKDFVLWKVGL
ncbi:translation elongation factor Ts [Chlamydia gallinacea]|uniref:Elongation factor Ts n=2 Tax=Chlamydia gallinacea TaxID=1457153 RepID=A0A173DYW4_9CHLA|nr:translation elongation factor Ts [Chlamydia gallinacea]EYE60574.1 translation elongation factor Ts [Bacteroides fragilis str. S6L5]ANG66119.1 translation elongation factor Ts [Chlamydia gallinacea 08-1274/3]AQT77663.1 translation elongation factor Ts [Chlamydia gallinacea]MBX6679972.1 elongation factor Ts [Chlamydia gallinacea]MBX6687204.1 elongation factor Ts [Chlamydia gallinacea]